MILDMAGSYTFTTGYDKAGHVTTAGYPAAGGLPAETVTSTYTELGHANTLTGAQSYVARTDIDPVGRLAGRAYCLLLNAA